jgi:MFS family permease
MNHENRGPLIKIFIVGFLFSLHVALTLYVNSSFLANYLSESLIGILYTISSVLSIIGLQVLPRIIESYGALRTLGALTALTMLALSGLAFSTLPLVLGLAFIVYFGVNTLIYFGIDVCIDALADRTTMGRVRGTYLTAMNIGFMLAPFLAGLMIRFMGYASVYITGLILLIPVFVIVHYFIPPISYSRSSHASFLGTFARFFKVPDLRNVFLVNFMLQFFYAWTVIYTPLFLVNTLGISWEYVGIMFTAMLSAFVITQYPFGSLADKKWGEQELMILGMLCMGLMTIFFAGSATWGLGIIALILFISRIGASATEIASESFFFKKNDVGNVAFISFFRNTYPLAYIIAPLIGSALLGTVSFPTLFIILGIICIVGSIPAWFVNDTR